MLWSFKIYPLAPYHPALEPFPFRRMSLNDQKVRRNKELERETDPT